MAVVGDFDPAAVRDAVESAFGGWRSRLPFQPAARVYRDAGAVELRLNKPGRHSSILEMGIAIDLDQNSAEYPALLLGSYLMGGGFLNSRLPARIRRQEGLSYWIESHLYGGPLEPVLTFVVTAACEPENLSSVKRAVVEELDRSLKGGFGPGEVEAAKKGFRRERQLSRSSDGELAASLASDLFAGRTRMWHAGLEHRIASLTSADVTDAWRRYIRTGAMSVVEAGDLAAAGQSTLRSTGATARLP